MDYNTKSNAIDNLKTLFGGLGVVILMTGLMLTIANIAKNKREEFYHKTYSIYVIQYNSNISYDDFCILYRAKLLKEQNYSK